LELLRNRSLELEHSKELELVLELVHSKVLELVLVHSKELALELRSMVLELVRSSLTSLHAAWKANP
jgi:hypothetical protein